MNNKEKHLDEVDKKIPVVETLLLAFQHVLVMCAGAIAVPLIVGNAVGLSQNQVIFLISADLFLAGIATVIQSIGIKNIIGAKVPLVLGTSFVSVNAMVAIAGTYKGDPETAITTIFGAVLIAGLFCFLMAPFFGKLLRFLPKVVTGTVVTIIGLSLLPVAIRWSAGNNIGAEDFASSKNIYMALFVLGVILILSKVLKGVWNNMAILLGIIIGTIVSSFFGMVDFTLVREASFIGIVKPFYFGMPRFDISAIMSLILIVIVSMTESTGNMMAIHEIVGKKVDNKQITRGLRCDGLATMMAAIFNTFPHTCFGQNIGLVNLTGVKSRYVTSAAGFILIILGIFPKLAAIIAAIPYPVLGGAGFIMFGMVVSGGINTLGKVQFNGTKNGIIVAVSIGVSLIPLAVPNFYQSFPTWVNTLFHSGITTGSLMAIILNILFNEVGNNKNSSTINESNRVA